MKLKNLLYICIGAILIIACVGLVYINLDNVSDDAENSSKDNNTSSVNNSNISVENKSNNSTNEISSVKNTKDSKTPVGKNEPKNIPKKSRLSYSEALNIAKKASKDTIASYSSEPEYVSYIKAGTYLKYEGYYYSGGDLVWNFKLYSKKNNKLLDVFGIHDPTGYYQ